MKKKNVASYIGKRLRLRRTMMGLNQEAIAKVVGVAFQQVQKYEKGEDQMSVYRLYQFTQCLHVPVSYFFYELENKIEEPNPFGFSSEREMLELMKALNKVKGRAIRRSLSKLLKSWE